MERKLTFLTVCAAVVLSSLAVLPTTAAADYQMQTECQIDNALLDAYEAVAIFQAQKFTQSIFDEERRAYCAKSGAQDKNPTADGMFTEETCVEKLFVPWRATYEATLSGALVLDPEAFSNVSASETVEITRGTELMERICSAITLALEENQSEAADDIQAIADERAAVAAAYNADYFQLLRNGYTDPKTIRVIQNSESRSNSSLRAALFDIFGGIEILSSFETHADSRSIWSVIEAKNNRAFAEIRDELTAKFELLKKLSIASCIIQFGTVDTSSVTSAVIKESASCSYEKVRRTCSEGI